MGQHDIRIGNGCYHQGVPNMVVETCQSLNTEATRFLKMFKVANQSSGRGVQSIWCYNANQECDRIRRKRLDEKKQKRWPLFKQDII